MKPLAMKIRRNGAMRSKSSTLWPPCLSGLCAGRGIHSARHHCASSESTMPPDNTSSALRKPRWSIENPATSGPRKLAIENPTLSRL